MNLLKSIFRANSSVNMAKDLTDTQKDICTNDGNFVVRACPGSGKTFTVAAKMARLLNKWPFKYQGIAVISFTNVAWQEIENKLKSEFEIDTPNKHPHFLGTIDSFINNIIFSQYGHLVLNCDSRPILAGEPVYSWKYKRYDRDPYQFFDKVSYDINDEIMPLIPINKFKFRWQKFTKKGLEDKNYSKIEEMKEEFLEKGYANQSDANYFSMKLLKSYPDIAKLIALRFPYVIIDEAQDTSDIQMEIINCLFENGLKNLILVGDPDQAIFEWNNAKPELFNHKFNEWKDPITMNENWRSSQNICDFTYHLSSLESCSDSVNEIVSDCNHVPQIKGYDPNNDNFDELINSFLDLCLAEGININPSNVAVLARSKDLIIKINSKKSISEDISDMWNQKNYAKELAYSKYLYDKSMFRESFKLLEKTYISLGKTPIYSDLELSEIINEKGYFKFKEEIFNLIKLMPKTGSSIGEWIDKFQENCQTNILPNLKNLDLEIDDKFRNLTFDEIFYWGNDNEYNCRLSTIHQVKGETFEAVMLILKQRATSKSYKKLLEDNAKISDNEELRNLYVGITRPKKILILAVPSTDKNSYDTYFHKNTLDCFF